MTNDKEKAAREYASSIYPTASSDTALGRFDIAKWHVAFDAFIAGRNFWQSKIDQLKAEIMQLACENRHAEEVEILFLNSEINQLRKDLEESKKREQIAIKIIEDKRKEIEGLTSRNSALN